MPYVEQTDLINVVTEHVLRTSLAQVRAWSDEGIEIPVAVNLSARSCHDLRLPDKVAALLAAFDVPRPPSRLASTTRAGSEHDPGGIGYLATTSRIG